MAGLIVEVEDGKTRAILSEMWNRQQKCENEKCKLYKYFLQF